MPKPNNTSEPKYLGLLLRSLENKLGFRLSSAARCRQAEAALQAAGHHVSYATLHRFSQQTPNAHRFYVSTLDQLATFVCNHNWDGFIQKCNRDELFLEKAGIVEEQEVRSLLSYCVQHNELRALHDFSEQLPTDIDEDRTIRLGFEFYQALQHYPAHNRKFFKNFSQLPFIRKAFFEYLADPEFRIPQYTFGLQQFVKNTTAEGDKKQLQDFIFANTLLLRHAYRTNDIRTLKEVGKLLYANSELEKATAQLNIFPRTRYQCYRILWLMAVGKTGTANALKIELAQQYWLVSTNALPYEQEAMLNILLDVYLLTRTPRNQCLSLVDGFRDANLSLKLKQPTDLQAVLQATDHTRANWMTTGQYR
ncbi:MAG: hypothetical protein K9G41_12330 [Flavobacteriales bacterium]|nr:hypothetical protein [Flavobacteriales bacterium]